ncbi:hypothetical protein O6H91_01G052900 [Diphasiastrum complanatum]|uniref:Uncharacterized protein n=1 Tax=Diphasiastrum complanatum TaxID=34168 RepID=A0ACC2ERB6_DIPCM|nr:hypothetical protein O6H91_01G052900 [Diphasiastrum complanatum]
MESIFDEKIAEEFDNLYFDMDMQMLDNRAYCERRSTSSNSPEFEFNLSSTSGVYDIADELFFHGQLLPLHVSLRVLMVQRLSSCGQRERQQQQIQEAEQNSSAVCESYDKDLQKRSYHNSNSVDSCCGSKDMKSDSKGRRMARSQTSTSGQAQKSSSWLRAALQGKLLSNKALKIKGKKSSRSLLPSEDKQGSNDFVGPQTTALSSCLKTNHGIKLRNASSVAQRTQKTKVSWQRYLKASRLAREIFPVKRESHCRLNEHIKASGASETSDFSLCRSTFTEQPSWSEFLSRNMRVPSFARRSSTTNTRVNSSQCSPTRSGVLQSLHYSTISDMQNAIQGAIAHCKQSQASNQAPF